MASGLSEERAKAHVFDYFGGDARIRIMRLGAVFGERLFVVDFDRGPRHFRTLGSFGAAQQVTEQSSMDLLYPARLVFHYERLMSLGLALAERPVSALLLGVGGAAMWRFLRAYLPECATTLVDCDETVLSIARRWFYLKDKVVIDGAARFLAGRRERFDAVLVDLYNAAGPAAMDRPFWARALDALAAGGCLAVNWADFSTNPAVRPMAEALAEEATGRGCAPIFVTRRGFHDNLVQYVPTGQPAMASGDFSPLYEALERFARERHIPDRGRGILENCLVTTRFPLD